MSTALALPSPAVLAELADLVERANGYAADARAGSTRRRYLTAFASFEAWCTTKGLVALPATPAVVALYVTELADKGRALSTIEVTLAAVSNAHRIRRLPWPRGNDVLAAVMTGVRRRLGAAPHARKAAVEGDALARLVATLGTDVRSARDRAVLCIGWWGAFRRAELVSLDVADLEETADGLLIHLRRSKGDQQGHGLTKGLPFYPANPAVCPVQAVRAWRREANVIKGPLFRGVDSQSRVMPDRLCDRSIARIVQAAAKKAGLNADVLGGHSLRAGFCTTAARRGKSLETIMRHTGHKDERVARDYIRLATVFHDSAATGLTF